MQAMILAAGLGTRLRPYSELRPKPLFPVLGRPLLLAILDRLRVQGFSPIIINTHHLGGQIVDLLAGQPDIIIQQEPIILGTGGGLRMALDHFDDLPILVVNGDIYHDIDYRWVWHQHMAGDWPVSMIMHDVPRFNKVAVGDNGFVQDFASLNSSSIISSTVLAFTGIHITTPDLLRDIAPGRFSCIIERYKYFVKEGGIIRSLKVEGHLWKDIGTPGDYLALHRMLLSSGKGFGENFQGQNDFRYSKDVSFGVNVELKEWGFIGSGADIGSHSILQRVVVWDGAKVAPGSVLRDTIVC